MKIPPKDIGICSYAYRYNVGTAQFTSPRPLDPLALIGKANALGYGRVQFYDNIGSDNFDAAMCGKIAGELAKHDMSCALGVRHIGPDTLPHFLPLAQTMTADCFRFAIPMRTSGPETVAWAIPLIEKQLPLVERYGITLGLENHFSLPPEYLVEVAARLNHPLVRCVFDTTNSICFIEKPKETLGRMRNLLHTIHIKDFVFLKMEAGYMMNGVALGDGVLDIMGILREAMACNPRAKVELELTMNRPEDRTPEQILAWEEEVIANSTKVLFEALEEL